MVDTSQMETKQKQVKLECFWCLSNVGKVIGANIIDVIYCSYFFLALGGIYESVQVRNA